MFFIAFEELSFGEKKKIRWKIANTSFNESNQEGERNSLKAMNRTTPQQTR